MLIIGFSTVGICMMLESEKKEVRAKILSVRDGDESAFEELLTKYRPLLESVVSKFSNDPAAVRDDLRQEATVVFYQAIMTFDTEQSDVEFGLYAKICMTNALVSQLRSLNRRRVESLVETKHELLFVHETEDPSSSILEQERLNALYSVIRNTLSDFEYRVWQYYMSGQTAAEIGKHMGKDEKSISNAVYRIRKKLRATLNPTSL